jgi:hypothetical protein
MSKSVELRVLRGDVIHGPFNHDQVQDLVVRGRLSRSDLVSAQGGPWVRISQYLGEAPPRQVRVQPATPSPPVNSALPEPTSPEVTPATRPALDWSGTLLWVYRGLLAVAVVGVASPWYTASTEISAPFFGAGGSRASMTGLSVAWGILSLLLLLGGGVASFLTRAWKVHCGLAATAVGLVALAAAQWSSAGPFGVNAEYAFGGTTVSGKVGLDWGLWLTMASGAAAAGVAYATGNRAVIRWLGEQYSPTAEGPRLPPFVLPIVCCLGVVLGTVSTLVVVGMHGEGPYRPGGATDAGANQPKSNKEGAANGGPTASLTVDEFRKACVWKILSKEDFYTKFGRPQRISTVGDTYLYYHCKDGTAAVRCRTELFQGVGGRIVGKVEVFAVDQVD